MEAIYTCDACRYIFEATDGCNQCPDCGKRQVRPANEDERKEYLERKENPENWIGNN